jgi:two-component system OmpR family sensor kinase
MRLPRLRFGLRERIWLTVVAGIGIVLVGMTAGFNLLVAGRLTEEANAVAVARAAAELDALRVTESGIHVVRPDGGDPIDTPTWVFEGSRAIEGPPRASRREEAAARALTRRGRGFVDLPSRDIRLYGLPVLQDGRRVGSVVGAVGLAQYEQIARTALLGSSALALFALIAVAVASRWVLSRALRPVGEMTRQAADWSEHDLERRFGLGEPHDEFTTLAATLDGLLDRVAASLRHEQNLTADLSHELRTPLTQITAEAQFALRHGTGGAEEPESYERILRSARYMTQILDTLMAAARAQATSAPASGDAAAAARTAIEAIRPVGDANAIDLELIAPATPTLARVHEALLERVLSPLLENACRFARHRVTVEVTEGSRGLQIIVGDDGPGIAAADAEHVFTPGVRGGEGTATVLKGAGLGLPLARRLAQGVGGDVRVDESPVGARVIVTLPRG